MHASTVSSGECASVSVVFFFLEPPTPLASFGRPSATGVPSVVVDAICKMQFGTHVGCHAVGHIRVLKACRLGAMLL